MAYCRKCGKLLPDGANHCTICGTSTNPQQPSLYDTGRLPRVGIPPQESRQPQHQQPYQNQYPQYPNQQPQYPNPPQPRPEQQPKKPQKARKKKSGALIALYILLGILVAALLGLGGYLLWSHFHVEEKDPHIGMYEVVSCIRDGEDAETAGEWIRLRDKGKATVYLEGETSDGAWALEGSDLTITLEEDVWEATLEDDTITLELDDTVYTFRKEAETIEASGSETTPQETQTVPRDLSWWEGDWYGWWIVTEGSGDMYLLESAAFDVCARITLAEEGTGTFTMWDMQEGSCQARWDVSVSFPEGDDGQNFLISEGGTFLNGEVAYGDWNVNPTEYPYRNFSDMICIRGTYQDPEDPENSCSYSVFLRPWGTEWEDIRTGDMTDMPYPDMMPIGYDSWYLPLIREGQEMPVQP